MKISILLLFAMMNMQDNWLKYKSDVYKFSLEYPSGWELKDVGTGIAFISPKENTHDNFQESVNVIIQEIGNATLDQYTKNTQKQVTTTFGAKATESLTSITFLNQPAKEYIYHAEFSGLKYKLRQVWFIKSQKAYLFTYTAEEKEYLNYEQIAKKIFESFSF